MFRRVPAWLALACVPALAACSLLLGEGFTGENGASSSDGGATNPDGQTNGGAEAGSDGSPNPTMDGSPGTDGGGPRADGGFVCPSATVSFCDGFERQVVQGDWSGVDLNVGGALTIVQSGNTSRLESKITGLGGQAQLKKSFTVTPKTLHFDFTMELPNFTSTGGVYITGVYIENGSNPPTLLYLYANPFGVFFVEQVADGVAYEASAVPFATGAPHRLVIDLTFGGKLIIKVDGDTKVDKFSENFLLAKPPVLHLGGGSIDGTGNGLTMRVDDFIFTID